MKPATTEVASERAIYRAVQNYMINEVLAGAAHADGEKHWKHWLRRQFLDALQSSFAGSDQQLWVERAIRKEVSSALSKWGTKDALRARIDEIIREEVKALLKANLKVDATLSLDVNPKRYEDQGQF